MFWENFYKLCLKIGKSPNAVAKELEISSGAITSWKSGRCPHHKTMIKLADYFGVSVDYLLGKEEAPIRTPELSQIGVGDVRMIPLYESASAGFGSLALNEIVDYVPLYIPNQTEASETICIKVSGDSMSPQIENGDIVQVRKTQSIESGTVAVVLLDNDEGLLKRVTFGDNWIELRSANPMYKPMRFNGADTQRVRVVGTVVKIIKDIGGKKEHRETTPGVSDSEQALLELFRAVPEDKRDWLMQVIRLTLNKG